MKIKIIAAALLSLSLASGGLMAAEAGHDHEMSKASQTAKAKASEKAKAKARRDKAKLDRAKKEHWTCPMHPEIDMPKPGSCPKCHMDLIKKEVKK